MIRAPLVYHYEFGGGPFDVVVQAEGEASRAQFREGEQRLLSDPRYRGGLNLLYDLSALDPTPLRGDDVRAIAAADLAVDEPLQAARVAVVAPSDLMYGLSRMWQGLIAMAAEERTTVVRTVAEAHAWLVTRTATRQTPP
jgi:hypothetical protein